MVLGRWTALLAVLAILIYPAQEFFVGAWNDLKRGRLGMDVPIVIGLSAAFLSSVAATLRQSGEVYYDSIAMLVFFVLLARRFELRGRLAAARVSDRLARVVPRMARRVLPDGAAQSVALIEVRPGDRLRVLPGELVPVDGVLVEGGSSFDESLLTGESAPVWHRTGEAVIGGSRNVDQSVVVEVTHRSDESTVSNMQRLLAQALRSRPRGALLAERAAAWFVPAVLVIALFYTDSISLAHLAAALVAPIGILRQATRHDRGHRLRHLSRQNRRLVLEDRRCEVRPGRALERPLAGQQADVGGFDVGDDAVAVAVGGGGVERAVGQRCGEAGVVRQVIQWAAAAAAARVGPGQHLLQLTLDLHGKTRQRVVEVHAHGLRIQAGDAGRFECLAHHTVGAVEKALGVETAETRLDRQPAAVLAIEVVRAGGELLARIPGTGQLADGKLRLRAVTHPHTRYFLAQTAGQEVGFPPYAKFGHVQFVLVRRPAVRPVQRESHGCQTLAAEHCVFFLALHADGVHSVLL